MMIRLAALAVILLALVAMAAIAGWAIGPELRDRITLRDCPSAFTIAREQHFRQVLGGARVLQKAGFPEEIGIMIVRRDLADACRAWNRQNPFDRFDSPENQ